MSDSILNTPGGTGQIPAGKVLVGDGYTGDLATFNGKIFVIDLENLPDPLNPLNLPPNTMRVKFKSGYTPTMGDTQTLVDATNNIWDIGKTRNEWNSLFNESSETHNLLEVLGANTKNVTDMTSLFHYCTSLTNVALFDTSNVTNMTQMFYNCTSLITVPLFNTSKVTKMFNMFRWDNNLISVPLFDTSNVTEFDYVFATCTSLTSIPLFDTSKMVNVKSCFESCVSVNTGILDLYNRMINQTNPPTSYDYCFHNCGRNSTTGAAELAQIPNEWKDVWNP